MEQNLSIKVESLSKIYRIYKNPADRFKEALDPRRKKYSKDFYALKDISFSIAKGETLGIIGKNGAGKSTLLKIITGVLSQTSGLVETNGHISSLLELGTGFNPEISGIENVFFNGALNGFSKEDMAAKLDAIVAFADIGDFINQPVKTYSSGMFARLAFAVAIHVDPEILIIDEALSVGDCFFQAKCNLYMKEKMDGKTKILVTHDLATVSKMSTHVLWIDDGEVKFKGDPGTAVELYLKSLHNDTFGGESNNKSTDLVNTNKDAEIYSEQSWSEIPEESLAGAMNIKFQSSHVKVNNEQTPMVSRGDEVDIFASAVAVNGVENLIFGYQIVDRHGTAICGENTFSSQNIKDQYKDFSLKSGERIQVHYTFKWPEIHEGEYFLRLGVGSGYDSLKHTIECWAHNIYEWKCVTYEKQVHGIFNNEIESFEIKKK